MVKVKARKPILLHFYFEGLSFDPPNYESGMYWVWV